MESYALDHQGSPPAWISFPFLKKFILLYFYFRLCWVFVAECRLSLVGEWGVVVRGLLIAVVSLVAEHGL